LFARNPSVEQRKPVLIYLIRHALADYTTGTPYHLMPGPGLSETGREEASATARLLARSGIELVVSSPMRRCVQTAEPLCATLSLDLQLDDDLGEMRTGEKPAEMALRMLRATLAYSNRSAVALVSHAAPIEQLILALTRGEALLPTPGDRGARIGTAHVWQVLRDGGNWRAHHLPAGGVRL
jgi:broad specificity phosphatase PhoE